MGGIPSKEECAIVHAGRRRMQAEVLEQREAKKRRRNSLGHNNCAAKEAKMSTTIEQRLKHFQRPPALQHESLSKCASRVSFSPILSRSPKHAAESPPQLPPAPLWRDTAVCFVCRGAITRKRVEKYWQQKVFASNSFLGHGVHLDLVSAITSGARLVVVVADPTLSLASVQAWLAAQKDESGVTIAKSDGTHNAPLSKNVSGNKTKKVNLLGGRRSTNPGTRNLSSTKDAIDVRALNALGIQVSAHSDSFVVDYAVPLAKKLSSKAAPSMAALSDKPSESITGESHRVPDTFAIESAASLPVELSQYPCHTLAEALGLVPLAPPSPAITMPNVSSLLMDVNDRELTYGGYSNEPISDSKGKPNPCFSHVCQQQQQQKPVVFEGHAAPVARRPVAGPAYGDAPPLNAPHRFESTFDGGFRDLRRRARKGRQPRAASLNDLRGAPSSPYLASPRSSEQTPERHSSVGDDFEGQYGVDSRVSMCQLDMRPGASTIAGSLFVSEAALSNHLVESPDPKVVSRGLCQDIWPRPCSSVSCVFDPDGPGAHLNPITWACQRNGSGMSNSRCISSGSTINFNESTEENGDTVAAPSLLPSPKSSYPHPANLKVAGVLRAVADAMAMSESDKGYSFRAAAYRKLANRVQKFPGKLCRADQLNRPLPTLAASATDATTAASGFNGRALPESPKDEEAGSSLGHPSSSSRKCGNSGHGAILSAKMLDRLDVVLRGETRVEVILEQYVGAESGQGGSTSDINGSNLFEQQFAGRLVTLAEAQRSAVRELSGIWGVGNATAAMLVSEHGVKGVADLRRRVTQSAIDAALLSHAQHIGLRRYEDLLKRMPRAEAGALGDVIKKYARALLPGVQVEVCGSFRRGALMCGDVDVLLGPPPGAQDFADVEHLLLCPNSPKSSATFSCSSSSSSTCASSPPQSPSDAPRLNARYSTFLPRLLAILRHEGVLTDDLSNPKDRTSRGHCASYMGVGLAPLHSQFMSHTLETAFSGEIRGQEKSFEPGTYRRIDLKAYPRAAYPFALFYFTGSGHFNRSVRLWAKQHGWSLTDTGLVPKRALSSTMAFANADAMPSDANILALRSEADIFAALGLEYRTPFERSVDEIETIISAHRGQDGADDMLPVGSMSDVMAADAAHRAQKKYR